MSKWLAQSGQMADFNVDDCCRINILLIHYIILYTWYINELEYSKYVNNHDIFLCGDFNARTRNSPGFITDEYTVFIGGQPNFVSSDILADSQRYNMDTKANTYGKQYKQIYESFWPCGWV